MPKPNALSNLQGQTNPAFQSSQLSIADLNEMKTHASKESLRSLRTWTEPNISIDRDRDVPRVVSMPKRASVSGIPPVDIIYSWNNINIWTGPKSSKFKWFSKSHKSDENHVTAGGGNDTVIDIKSGGKQLLKNGKYLINYP
jgi:hypothetical protein